METTNLNIRVDKDIKAAAEDMFEALGMTMSTAVNIFLRQAIRENGIPFEIKLNIPNEVTAAAIQEGRMLVQDEASKGYRSMSDLKAALDI